MDTHDSTSGTAPSLDPAASADGPVTGSDPHDQLPVFMAELARAMQVAAGHEHERIVAAVADDATAHVERTQARAATEAEELRRLADEDIERIHAWSATEIERIRADAARRTDQRRTDLEDYLLRHDAIIATEVDGVHIAVQEYRAALEAFFDSLIRSSDPADIAARAGSIPPPPDLDAVRALARSGAVARLAEAPATASDDTEVADITDVPHDLGDGGDAGAAGAGDARGAGDAGGAGDAARTPGPEDPPNEVDASGEPAPAATTHEPPWVDAPVRVGVMDPEAIGSVGGLPTERQVAASDAATPAEPAADEDADREPGEHASTAVRLLRSIAPWTAPTIDDEAHSSATKTH